MNLFKFFRCRPDDRKPRCLQCGLAPGREYMVSTPEPIIHPHECSWCRSIVYFPGLMRDCKICSPDTAISDPAA